MAGLAVGAFHLAYEWSSVAALIVVYLAAMFRLAWVPSARWAFYSGLAIGFAIAAPQLAFLWDVFGPGVIGLWAVLGVWQGLYLLLAWHAVNRWPRYGVLWLPVVWFALEYFRSELYHLRFSWLTPGYAISGPGGVLFLAAGVYGVSFCVLLVFAVASCVTRRRAVAGATIGLLVGVTIAAASSRAGQFTGPRIVGIQLEGPSEPQVLDALSRAVIAEPEADLFVLSEYTFDGPVPQSLLEWCRAERRHVVVGGKDPVSGTDDFYNTSFVISPEGKVIFRQAKVVPIQFFNDGLPAPGPRLWQSPWGKIGFALCYDLSYSRVTDRLIAAGAEALIIPTSDLEEWGEHEHILHARVASVRAREYGVPVMRLASSGISQLVDREGRVIASAPFPGHGERLAGVLPTGRTGRLPPDRYLALPAVAATCGLILWLAFGGWFSACTTRRAG